MAKKKSVLQSPDRVPCPFKILIDTNESSSRHKPFTFQDILSNKNTGELPFEIETEVRYLQHLGDYQIDCPGLAPWEQPRCAVERKSGADLFQSVTKRENMEWRLNLLDTTAEFAVVVVESELSSLQANPPSHYEEGGRLVVSGQTFKSVYSTIQAWQQRFQRVHWCFCPDRDWAELSTFWYFYRFWENLSKFKLDRDRKRKNYRAYLEGMQSHRRHQKITESPYERKHAFGDYADYWVRGWQDHEKIARDQISDPHEPPLINDETLKEK